MSEKSLLPVFVCGLVLSGCPTPAGSEDVARPDASTADATPSADATTAMDTAASGDAGTDARVASDAPGDTGPMIPPIAMPDPRRVAASTTGHDRFYGVAFDRESGFYVLGVEQAGTAATDDVRTVVAHFTASGELDSSFGTAGFFRNNFAVGTSGELGRGIGVQSDGKIVIALTVESARAGADARDRDILVARLLPNGTLDTSFGTSGTTLLDLSAGLLDGTTYRADQAYNLAIDATDRIVIAGQQLRSGNLDTDFAVIRLTANGARDTSFATNGVFTLDIGEASASPKGLLLGPDGSLYAGGYYSSTATVVNAVIYKLDTNGALVTAFGTGGVYNENVLGLASEVYSLGLQGTHLVTAGYGRPSGTVNDFLSLRVNATTGVRDTAYGGGRGYFVLDSGWPLGDNARQVVALPDGRSLMMGQLRGPVTADATSGDQDAALVMLRADGALDTSFDGDGVRTVNFGGFSDHFWAGAYDARSGRIAVVGIATAFPATHDDGAVLLFPAR